MKQKSKIKTGTKFLFGVILIYLIILIFNFSFAKEAFLNFLLMSTKVIPLLGIVFVIMVFTNLYFTRERVDKYLGEKSGIKGWIYAIISGVIVSGPPYILYPLLGDLKKGGMKKSLLATFLFNRNVKISFIPVMIYYFGLNFTIVLSVYIILFSVLNGVIVGKIASNKS